MADYNINAVTRRVVFTGSAGVGPYSFTFEVLDQNDLAVYFNTTKLTLTTDYTVSIAANGTGSVTIVVGTNVPTTPDADDTIIIVGARDIERTTDFVTAGDLRASALNEQLDGLTIFDQQIAEEQKRTLQAPVYDPAHVDDGGTLDMTLPAKAARAGKYLQFNSTTGNPEAGPDSTDVTALADIATDIATLADIQDGTVATNAITTVSGISANVTTVAGVAANVSTVAGISSDVTSVAADATDIGTVATNIASVNTVAGNISEVIAVANDLNEAVSEVETVANDLNEAVSEIETVAASISNVDAVGTNIANVNTVAGNNSNVTTVAGISANVTTVAGISGNVTTVAGISADVTTVAADGTDIGTVATNITNVNSVAGNTTNINSVAGNSTNINTVAGISADVTTVAGDSAAIQAVAADATDIGTVSTNIANVNTVAGSIANVNATAANITGVNSFAERYRVGATDPTTSLDEGYLFFNTTDNTYKFYDGTSWQTVNVSGIGSVLDDATPQLGGNLDTNGNDITFGDNDKATFGDAVGGDLQIFHDGSNSYVKDSGAGYLILGGQDTGVAIQNTSGQNLLLTSANAITLSYQNSPKLATISGGIDVTGTVTADGLTVDTADGSLTVSSGFEIDLDRNGTNYIRASNASGGIRLGSGSAYNRLDVASSGDISFYAADQVTQGFYWDASTQRLGIGRTSPSNALDIEASSSAPFRVGGSSSGGTVLSQFRNTATSAVGNGSGLELRANSTAQERQLFFIDSEWTDNTDATRTSKTRFLTADNGSSANPMTFLGGNVGIGTAAPSAKLSVTGLAMNSASAGVELEGAWPWLKFKDTELNQDSWLQYVDSNSFIIKQIPYADRNAAPSGVGTERLRVDSSGNLLVGKTNTSTASQGCVLGAGGLTSFNRDNDVVVRVRRDGTDGDGIEFYNDASKVGSISLGASGTTYNTTSDIRLKTDIAPIADATDKLMAMNAVTHKWKADPDADAVVGFIAQEMAEIVPEAVSKGDSEDDMWSMDYGRITPVLVAALQDAVNEIKTLKERVAELEAK